MIRTWPGQTKEEWIKEYKRDKALTAEERSRELKEHVKLVNDEYNKANAEKIVDQQRRATENPFANCDHPNSLENNEATIIWVVVMVIASIFTGGWVIWIISTIIWRKYITRHKIKK